MPFLSIFVATPFLRLRWAVSSVDSGLQAGGRGVRAKCSLTNDLRRLARAMEAELYPVRPDEQPREGARKCARFRALPTVPEEEAAPDVAGVPGDESEGASMSVAAHAPDDAAIAGGASWAKVLAMQEVGVGGTGGMGEVDDDWGDCAGGWDGGDGEAGEAEESGP